MKQLSGGKQVVNLQPSIVIPFLQSKFWVWYKNLTPRMFSQRLWCVQCKAWKYAIQGLELLHWGPLQPLLLECPEERESDLFYMQDLSGWCMVSECAAWSPLQLPVKLCYELTYKECLQCFGFVKCSHDCRWIRIHLHTLNSALSPSLLWTSKEEPNSSTKGETPKHLVHSVLQEG